MKITDTPALTALKIRNREGEYIRAIHNNLTNEDIPLPYSDKCHALNILLNIIYRPDPIYLIKKTPKPKHEPVIIEPYISMKDALAT